MKKALEEMTEKEVDDIVVQVLREALDFPDDKEIINKSMLVSDLKMQPVDFLDIICKLHKALGVELSEPEVKAALLARAPLYMIEMAQKPVGSVNFDRYVKPQDLNEHGRVQGSEEFEMPMAPFRAASVGALRQLVKMKISALRQ